MQTILEIHCNIENFVQCIFSVKAILRIVFKMEWRFQGSMWIRFLKLSYHIC